MRCNITDAAAFADPAWEPGGKHFEKARRAVARELKWEVGNVLDWEVRSYLRMRGKKAVPFNPKGMG